MDRRTAIRALATASVVPLASPTDLVALLDARRTLTRSPTDRVFRPAALTPHELELVGTVADIILPPSDTPGATDVGVHEFVDLIVAEWFDPPEAARFTAGLAKLDATSTARHGSGFLDTGHDDRTELVAELDRELAELRDAEDPIVDPDETFFHWMKRLTLTGYFTSAEGLRLLDHRTVPGPFEGCLVPEAQR